MDRLWWWGGEVVKVIDRLNFCVSTDYELIVESDVIPNKMLSSGWVTGGFESQEPAQFEERHLIFLQQLGKVTEVLTWQRPCVSRRQRFHARVTRVHIIISYYCAFSAIQRFMVPKTFS